MPKVLEKAERRMGEKLLLKGERCSGPKCALVRRNYPPGAHGKKRKRGPSEYGSLLREKQKIRLIYGLDDKDVRRYSKEAAAKPGIFSSNFLQLLERRLDNVVFRLGFARSRREARHAVSYGHIILNDKTTTIPSVKLKKGDVVGIKEKTLKSSFFAELDVRLKKYETPKWLKLDKEKKTGALMSLPEADDAGITVDITKIKEFYSR